VATRIPDVQVELYGTTTLAWVDVSSALRTDSGVSIKRGRGTRFDTCGPATCSFTLDNPTGAFTPDNSSGTYWAQGNWAEKNQQIRVTIDSVQVFEGFVDSFTAYVTGDGECLCNVVASDLSKFLARNPLGPYGVEKSLLDLGSSTTVVYPLSSNIGADLNSGYYPWRDNTAGTLSWATTTDGAKAWDTDAPPFCGGSLKLVIGPTTAIGRAMDVPTTWNPATGGGVFGWFKAPSGGPLIGTMYQMYRTTASVQSQVLIYLDDNGAVNLDIYRDGSTVRQVYIYSGQGYNDDTWHSFGVTVDSTGKIVKLYVDGVQRSTTTVATALTISATGRKSSIGAPVGAYIQGTVITAGLYGYTGSLSTIAIKTSAPASTDASDFHGAGIDGDTGDSITARAGILMSFLYPTGSPTITVSDVSAMTLTGQDTNNRSLFDVLNDIADSERGVTYVDRLGDVKFRGSTARTGASTVTIDALADLDGTVDMTLIDDDSLFSNRIVASGPAGTMTVEDTTLVTRLGVVSEAWTCIATSLSTPASARLAARIDNTPRIGQVTVDLMTKTSVSTATCLGLVPLDKVTLTNLPTQLGATSRQAVVEGYTLTASTSQYSMTLDLSPVG